MKKLAALAVLTSAVAFAPSAFAKDGGFYLGLGASHTHNKYNADAPAENASITRSAALGGLGVNLQGGYDAYFGKLFVGGEVGYNWSNNNASASEVSDGVKATASFNNAYYLYAKMKLGGKINESTTLYASTGLGLQGPSLSLSATDTTTNQKLTKDAGYQGSRIGYLFGAGLSTKLTPHIALFLNYDFVFSQNSDDKAYVAGTRVDVKNIFVQRQIVTTGFNFYF